MKLKKQTIPSLPGGLKTRKKSYNPFAKYLGCFSIGRELYELSAHMNSENSHSNASFLYGLLTKMRSVDCISVYLTTPVKRDIVEHHLTVTADPEREGFKTSFERFEHVLTNESLITSAIRSGNGGKGFFVDEVNGHISSFSLVADDFNIKQSKIQGSSNGKQTILIPLKSSDSDRVLGCLVVQGSDLRLKNSFFILKSITLISAASRLLYSNINRQLDVLTKLMHRDVFKRSLFLHSQRFLRNKCNEFNFSILLLDIDHFKKYNDLHGHQQGDYILREVASVMRSTTRARQGDLDIVARFGGEEFVALLETDIGGALSAASRIRKNIWDNVGVTCSIGVVDADAVHYLLTKELITLTDLQNNFPDFERLRNSEIFTEFMIYVADKAMYSAKNSGRNRVNYARKVVLGEDIYSTHQADELIVLEDGVIVDPIKKMISDLESIPSKNPIPVNSNS